MHDSFPVAIMDSCCSLSEKFSGDVFREASSPPNVVEQVPTCAQLHHEDQVPRGLEGVIETNDVSVTCRHFLKDK